MKKYLTAYNEVEQRDLIRILAKSFKYHKLVVYEDDMGYRHRSYTDVVKSRYIIHHIEAVIEYLDDPERFIIEKEIIEGKTGNWYLEYFSAPSYYRHRKKAYEIFLRCLDE